MLINTIKKTIQDILSPLVLKFILKIGLGSIVFWILALGYFWTPFTNVIHTYLTWIPFEFLQTTISYISPFFMGYVLIIITISTLTSIYSEKILISLAKKHYPKQQVIASPNLLESLMITISSTLLYLILLIILFPLFFIPLLGQALLLYLGTILLKAPTVHDVGGLFISNKKELKEKRKKSSIISILASLFSYIPILNIFAPIFAQIMFLHHILGKK